MFQVLRSNLGGEVSDETARELTGRLATSEENVKVIAFRQRQRLGAIVAEEVQQTVDQAEDWKEELRYLVWLLGQYGNRVTLDSRDRLVSLA